MTPAARIRSERRARGWTQQSLADQVGVNVRTVQKWESGTARPRNHRLLRLARLFGVDPELLA